MFCILVANTIDLMKNFVTILLIFSTIFSFGQPKEKTNYYKIIDSLNQIGQTDKIIPYFEKELKLKPKNEDVLRLLGYLYIENNKLDLGEKHYRDALSVNPNCARCYMNIGRVYAMKNDTINALDFFNKSLTIDANDALLYSTRAKLKAITRDKLGALLDFNKAIDLDPVNADYFILRGDYNSKQGYLSLALSDFNKSVELAPQYPNAYYQRAILKYTTHTLKEALEDANMAILLDSTKQLFYTLRGAIYEFSEEHDKAIADYTKAIILNPTDYLPYYYRSNEKYRKEDMDGSCSDIFECYAVLKKFDPNNSLKTELDYSIDNYCDSMKVSYYYQRGVAYYNLQQFDNAVQIYTVGINKFPVNSMILSFRGNAYFELKDYPNAILDYYASIKNQENFIDDIKANQKHTKINIDSLDIFTKSSVALIQKSIAESKFSIGLYDEALIEINKGIEITPGIKFDEKEYYYNVRGNIFIALGKYQLAINDFDKCILLNPSFSLAYVNRAVATISLVNKTLMTSHSINGSISNQAFQANWTFPIKTSVKKSDRNIFLALTDCNKAIEIEPQLNFAYYIRGQIKKMLSYSDYCYDLIKAKELGYPLEIELLNTCENK
jgi:tetratricopeptide (TPR) repeat protein